jgi:pyrimidine deaminase RibD-like protein
MNKTNKDFLKQAINLAKQSFDTTSPNPNVGCVIVNNNQIVGYGHHHCAGGHHAEINALTMADKQSIGADLYVTLEPCSHYGKTPPCVNAIIQAQIKRVIIGMQDPNPLVNGNGISTLKDSGIEVILLKHYQQELIELNLGFISTKQQTRPWICAIVTNLVDFNYKDTYNDIQHLYARNDVLLLDQFSNAEYIKISASSTLSMPDIIIIPHNAICDYASYIHKEIANFTTQEINYLAIQVKDIKYLYNVTQLDEIIFYVSHQFIDTNYNFKDIQHNFNLHGQIKILPITKNYYKVVLRK